MRTGWEKIPFHDVIKDESGGNIKTLQSEFLQEGRFAIVDQGKELIAGFTNDETRLCHSDLPVIVFGDHTRCFKFIDFPFCMGADGVKVLRPKITVNVKYLYHYLRQLKLTEGGYDRHFKYLKRCDIILPPLADQHQIVEILDRVEVLLDMRRSALTLLDTFIQSIFLKFFGNPTTNPMRWPRSNLTSLIRSDDTINYGVVQPGDDIDGGVPLIRVGDLIEGRINLESLKRIDSTIERQYKRSRIRGDEILVSCVGSIGIVALVDEKVKGFNIARAVARIPLADTIDRIFVSEYLKTDFVQRYFTNELRTVSQPTLNIKQLSETSIIVPPLQLQREFASQVRNIEQLQHSYQSSLIVLDELFTALQYHAFRGEL